MNLRKLMGTDLNREAVEEVRNMEVTIKIGYEFDESTELYYVMVNGETMLKCLDGDDLKSLTIGDLMKMYQEDEDKWI